MRDLYQKDYHSRASVQRRRARGHPQVWSIRDAQRKRWYMAWTQSRIPGRPRCGRTRARSRVKTLATKPGWGESTPDRVGKRYAQLGLVVESTGHGSNEDTIARAWLDMESNSLRCKYAWRRETRVRMLELEGVRGQIRHRLWRGARACAGSCPGMFCG